VTTASDKGWVRMPVYKAMWKSTEETSSTDKDNRAELSYKSE